MTDATQAHRDPFFPSKSSPVRFSPNVLLNYQLKPNFHKTEPCRIPLIPPLCMRIISPHPNLKEQFPRNTYYGTVILRFNSWGGYQERFIWEQLVGEALDPVW
ncbi:hypothetical protein Zmor_004980 [Zophobas morio]|uniref:Uncharacterized protein n=1 Tax=Zophobas morio TaxID=2755281 RepID=A0AA38IVA4_9CUCU|nr:hypothetical protein Zmor_004980 [Zophobas morio]